MSYSVQYKKVLIFKYFFIPKYDYRWCVIEKYDDIIAMGGDIAHIERERVIFKGKSKEACLDLKAKLNSQF